MYKSNMTRQALAAAAITLLFATAGFAQTPPTRIRGEIEKVDGDYGHRQGARRFHDECEARRQCPRHGVCQSVAGRHQSRIPTSASRPCRKPDGTQKAIAVHIFLEGQRGTGEGFRQWDLRPNSTMTNANVESKVASVDGDVVMVKYKDGEKKVIISKDTPVVAYAPGEMSEVKAGCADHHFRCTETVRRHLLGAGHQCRPWCNAADVTQRSSPAVCNVRLLKGDSATRIGKIMITRIMLSATCAVALLAASAQAQDKPLRVRGTVEQVDGRGADGQIACRRDAESKDGGRREGRGAGQGDRSPISSRDRMSVRRRCRRRTAAWKAVEVHIFPESMRGTGEGDRPYDYKPKSTMTNGTVGNVGATTTTTGTVGSEVAKGGGGMLTLTYKEGEKKIDVTPETVIVMYAAGSMDELKPGASIYIPAATRQADGSLMTGRVNVGRGIAPPM